MLKAKMFQFGDKTTQAIRTVQLRAEAAARRSVIEKMAVQAGANLRNPTHVKRAFARVTERFGA